MTDPDLTDVAFQADLDRLRAHFGAARLDNNHEENTDD